MNKLIMHWSAGSYAPSKTDKLSYHFLVDGNGNIHRGIYAPEANLCVKTGRYAAHTGGGNSGAIGVALCAMYGYSSPQKQGNFPIKAIQLEAFLKLCARLCKKYSIPITPSQVLTHYEFGLSHPNTSSTGKIDISFLPPYPTVSKTEVGDFLRQKVRWYYQKINNENSN